MHIHYESIAVCVGTLSVSLDGDLVQFLIREFQILGSNHTRTYTTPIHGYAQYVFAISKPCMLERQFHRIAMFDSAVLMFNYSTCALNKAKCSSKPDVNSFSHSHIITADCLVLKIMKKMWEWLVCTRKCQSSSESIIKK